MIYLVFQLSIPLLAEWHATFLNFLINSLNVTSVSLSREVILNLNGLVSPRWAVQTMNFHAVRPCAQGSIAETEATLYFYVKY